MDILDFSMLRRGSKGVSEGELFEELLRRAEKCRADGTLTREALDEFKRRAAPLLDEEQRRRLDEIIGKIE